MATACPWNGWKAVKLRGCFAALTVWFGDALDGLCVLCANVVSSRTLGAATADLAAAKYGIVRLHRHIGHPLVAGF